MTRSAWMLALASAPLTVCPASAQSSNPTPDCAPQAALFTTAKGLRLWVTRSGTASESNPLRPLSKDQVVVLQVVVNGRAATAFGPDYAHLRQGASPVPQPEGGIGPVGWASGKANLPDTLRIVAEDGTVLFGELRFARCEAAPAVAAPRKPAASSRPAQPKGSSRPSDDARSPEPRPRMPLPQGAIQ